MPFYLRHGAEYTDRLPGMVEAFGKLPSGELCLIDPTGAAHFYRLMAQMRTSESDESQLMFLVFDLLHQDGVDLRGLHCGVPTLSSWLNLSLGLATAIGLAFAGRGRLLRPLGFDVLAHRPPGFDVLAQHAIDIGPQTRGLLG